MRSIENIQEDAIDVLRLMTSLFKIDFIKEIKNPRLEIDMIPCLNSIHVNAETLFHTGLPSLDLPSIVTCYPRDYKIEPLFSSNRKTVRGYMDLNNKFCTVDEIQRRFDTAYEALNHAIEYYIDDIDVFKEFEKSRNSILESKGIK